MIAKDLWSAQGPPPAVLKTLERIAASRRLFEAVPPAGEEEACVAARAHAVLDQMEEIVCEEDARAPSLKRLWQELEPLEARMSQLRAEAACPEPLPQPLCGKTPANEGAPRPQNHGDPDLITTAIETVRSVARRAMEDPQPPAAGAGTRQPVDGLLPRIAALIARLFATGMREGNLLRIVARALATFLPLLAAGRPPAGPRPVPESATRNQARVDLLRQERAARARERRAAEVLAARRARPHLPPADRARPHIPPAGGSDAGAWHDLLDLTSEALEVFITHGDAAGTAGVAELLDLLAEAFAPGRPEAA